MGWENFLRVNEDPTDAFTQHRAQMRHYDDYMARAETAGITGSFSSGFSYGSGDTSSTGVGAISVAGPHSEIRVSDGERFTFRESKLPDKSDVGGDFGNMDLTQVMHPEVTAGKVGGLTWEASPLVSDVEEWAEKRYGDIGGAFVAPLVFSYDVGWNVARLANYATGGRLDRPLDEIGADVLRFLSPSPSVQFNIHNSSVAPDGVVWRTGGGF